MTFTAQASRVDALIRLVGLIVLAFGIALVYLTYANASVLAPPIASIDYALGVIFLVVGGLATIAKFK